MTEHDETLANAGERLRDAKGKEYWRSLQELVQSDGFRELVEREFPNQASELADPITRRRFLILMGASLGLAGLSGCGTSSARGNKSCPMYGLRKESLLADLSFLRPPCPWQAMFRVC